MPTFLIADDSQWKRDMLSLLVKREGLGDDLRIARTTEEADVIIEECEQIAFAFIDYEIPSAQGPSVINTLRRKHPSCLIALVTSSDSEQYRRRAMDAGANAFVCTSKPEDEVKKEIQDLLIAWKAERI